MSKTLPTRRGLLRTAAKSRVLVVGDGCSISFSVCERIAGAPCPWWSLNAKVYARRRRHVACNLTAWARVELSGLVGKDDGAKRPGVTEVDAVGSGGLKPVSDRMTTRARGGASTAGGAD